jgi:hypothetical protein
MKTVITYDLLDGGELDEDNTANGTLVDPIYVGVVDGAGLLADTGMNIWTVVAGGISAVTISGTLLLRSRRYQTTRR